ncbi:ABC transporter substrate-binding protein [Azoarcus communis]|uniref:ABC transporter substrate-binding protein n=1 Tax=Parazoarcus communis SWub3 = DSM 12120 TaxID=1121029 RepID=A0A323UZH8_9RHOO|nr:ABC transporter substrate-binding protein [Parazoarcus communis]NMG49642.1 ABC transporter substrate-binding protein [Parazoarcus communis]NMG70463.1 ABC transporter substrate-binding protein [Parazoarcus communis SWub3 = DSM 12120]PZA17120.1 ABC transporter substrate-binding protein [Azoarcus communis] [Parazoarcus communis SWub3 = DSM 12120]
MRRLNAMWRLSAGLCLGLLISTASAAPQRIVSLNLCTDQILLQLVERERIVALSFLSQDPFSMAMHDAARGLPTARGNAEEVLALAPDLVLVGTYTTRHTTALLRRFGIPVLAVPGARSFDEVAHEIRIVAEAVGEQARGEQVIDAFETRLAQLKATHHEPRPVTTQFVSGGYSAGSGTLYDDIFSAAGHLNGAARSGLAGYGPLPLEKLVEHGPANLVGSDRRQGGPTLGNRLLRHPAIAGMGARELVLPARQTICGGPWNLDAAEQLRVRGARP